MHLAALRTRDGRVTFFATRRPTEQLIQAEQEHGADHRMIVQSPHAERIAGELRIEFADQQIASDGHPMYRVEWEKLVDTVCEFDFATGMRMERDGVKVGDEVQVQLGLAHEPNKTRGTVRAIYGTRYSIDAPNGFKGLYTRNLIKPVVRVPALVGAA
jgi:hypothetical protein